VSVGNQPHSEVAALAIFLDRHTGGKALEKDLKGRLRIVPNPRGKTVIDRKRPKALKASKAADKG
jgi:tRNA (cytidine56-2'-O)-methyltransferase